MFVVRDLGSTNGTFVNGHRISGERTLKDGDVIGFGQRGPAVEFHVAPGEPEAAAVSAAARASAERISSPHYPAVAAGAEPRSPRASMTVRIAAEVARQTRRLRCTTKC